MLKERRAEHSNPFPRPASHAVLEAPQDALAAPGFQGLQLTHVQLVIDQNPQIPLCTAALQPLNPQTVRTDRAAPCQVWNLALALAEAPMVGDCPALYFVKISLQGLSTLDGVSRSSLPI